MPARRSSTPSPTTRSGSRRSRSSRQNAENAEDGRAFLDFLHSEEGQRGFAENGYRPVDQKVAKEFSDEFPEPPGLFDIEEFGGWETVATEFFDPESGSVAEIERDLGVVNRVAHELLSRTDPLRSRGRPACRASGARSCSGAS